MTKYVFGMVVAGALASFSGCATGEITGEPGREEAPEQRTDERGRVSPWSPPVVLRDRVTALDGLAHPRDVERPAEGWFVTPIHGTVLADGRVLVTGWGRSGRHRCIEEDRRLYGLTFLLDPADLERGDSDLAVTPIDEKPKEPGDVLYCSGHTPLADGRVLFAGGAQYRNLGLPTQEIEGGLDYARIYDPKSGRFQRLSDPMTAGPVGEAGLRWYPTLTRLKDGKVLVTGGFTSCCPVPRLNLSVELFDPAKLATGESPWTTLLDHDRERSILAASIRDYPHVWQLPAPVVRDGEEWDIAMLSGDGRVALFRHDGTAGSGRLLELDRRPGDASASDTTAALLATGELMTVGGTGGPEGRLYPFNADAAKRADLFDPATGNWRSADLGINRFTGASVLLPDGTALVVSGEGAAEPGDRTPQVVDPRGGDVRIETLEPWPQGDGRQVIAPAHRGYHNVALLLKDGRVLVGGGANAPDYVGCERPDVHIYSPPYLRAGHRPVLDEVEQLTMTVGGDPVELGFDGSPLRGEGGAVLMALGSHTHAFNQSQRQVNLRFSVRERTVRLEPPSTAAEAPPGDYFLFLIGSEGAPSRGITVRVVAPPR